jgi:hypothetical protein
MTPRGLRPGSLLPLLLLLCGTLLTACDGGMQSLPLAPGQVAHGAMPGAKARVVKRSSIVEEQVYSAVIDSRGGTLPIGTHGTQIYFPENALAEPTQIVARRDGDELRFTFEPHGIVFPEGAEPELRINYGLGVDYDETALQVVYTDSTDTVLEVLSTAVDTSSKFAFAKLAHFSVYVLASN